MTQPDTEAVRAHYRALAASYAARENKACKRAFRALAAEHLGGCAGILEIGCGASGLRGAVENARFFGCDLSPAMLAAGDSRSVAVADGTQLPFAGDTFDGAVSINVLEHAHDPAALLAEAARVLQPGGVLLAVTPNGNLETMLNLLETLRLKLPEGPHRFLTVAELAAAVPASLAIEWHAPMLVFPAGPEGFVRTIDKALGRWGLFQGLVARKADQG